VVARGSTLMGLHGIGPAGAARLLADVGDIIRTWSSAEADGAAGLDLVGFAGDVVDGGAGVVDQDDRVAAVAELNRRRRGRLWMTAAPGECAGQVVPVACRVDQAPSRSGRPPPRWC
jgi:transposase